nr:unnamed protein product [Callosobruchus chinensis]
MLNLFVANNNYETIKRKDFLKSLAKDLTLPLMKKRMYSKNIPPKMITKIRLLLDIDEEEPISQDPPRKIGRGRCYLCPRKNDKKTPIVCTKCQGWTCKTHQKILCSPCFSPIKLIEEYDKAHVSMRQYKAIAMTSSVLAPVAGGASTSRASSPDHGTDGATGSSGVAPSSQSQGGGTSAAKSISPIFTESDT